MIALSWLACTSTTITTTELPEARVGETYVAAIEADKRRRWVYSAVGLPHGLTINPTSGVVSGVPRVSGEFVVGLGVDTPGGQSRFDQDALLSVRGPREGCGRLIEGTFTEVALTSDLDWDATDGWRRVVLPLPDEDVEEITLDTEGPISLFGLLPGQTLDEQVPFFDQAAFVSFQRGAQRIGWNTEPNLGAYRALDEDITLIVTAFDGGDWRIETSCSVGPVVTNPIAGPFRLGEPIRGGFSAGKFDEDVVVEALDPLPPSLTLSEEGGLRGMVEEPGIETFRIRMTRRATGVESVTNVGVATYEPIPVACDETVPLPPTASLADDETGIVGADTSTRVDLYHVLEAEWADHVGLRWELTYEDSSFPPEGELRSVEQGVGFPFGGSDDTTFEVNPQTWPPASFYQNGDLRLIVGDFLSFSGTATLTCDDGPLLAETMLPVLEAETSFATVLDAVGGTPPLFWSATGLPEGVTLDADGTLTTDGTEFGGVEVEITLEDSEGVVTTTPLDLWSSTGAACDLVVPCGSTVTPTVAFGNSQVACLPPGDLDVSDWVAFVMGHDGNGQPGLLVPGDFSDDAEPDVFYPGYQGVLVASRGRNGLHFSIERYADRGWPLSLVQLEGSAEWTICARCGTGPTPPGTSLTCD